jgi:hypothetical protein
MSAPNQMPIDPLYATQSPVNIGSVHIGEPSAAQLTAGPPKSIKVAVPGPSPHMRPAEPLINLHLLITVMPQTIPGTEGIN